MDEIAEEAIINPPMPPIAETDSLVDYDGPDRVVSSIEFAEMIKNRPPLPKHLTGIGALDAAIDGFEPGELIVISGPTAMGKTLLCDTIMSNLRKDSKFSLFFTFEVSPEKIVQNHSTPESVIFLPLQHKSMDLKWLGWRILEAQLKYNCSAVFIDHLHYVIDMMTDKNMSLEIGYLMRRLKQMALSMQIPIFIVCHMGKLDLQTEPSIHHLRDSSFTGQEADTVLIVWRRMDIEFGKPTDSMLQGLASIKVAKARRTGAMGTRINVRKDGHFLIQDNEQN